MSASKGLPAIKGEAQLVQVASVSCVLGDSRRNARVDASGACSDPASYRRSRASLDLVIKRSLKACRLGRLKTQTWPEHSVRRRTKFWTQHVPKYEAGQAETAKW